MNAPIGTPSRALFEAAYTAGRGTLIWTTGVADLQTPVAAFLKLASGRPNSFLLESIEGGSARSRYSIIGMAPDLIWRCQNGAAEVNRHALGAPHAFVPDARPALDSLRALIADHAANLADQAGFNKAAVQPPAQHRHQQHQQRGQAQDAVERHGRAHAHAVGVNPLIDGSPDGPVDALDAQQHAGTET